MQNKNIFAHIARVALLVIIYSISSFGSVHADTVVTGAIPDGTVWNREGSPYIISETVTVPAGSTLTIEPGTTIKIENGSIETFGEIHASGTESDSINITSLKDDSISGDTNGDGTASVPAYGDWNGINMQDGSSGDFAYVLVRYGFISADNAALTVHHSQFQWSDISIGGLAPVSILNSVFSDASGSAVDIINNPAVTIEDTAITAAGRNALSLNNSTVSLNEVTISNTKGGQLANAVQLNFNSSLTVHGSTFDGGIMGIKLLGPNTLVMTDSVVKNFSKAGVYDTNGIVLTAAPIPSSISLASASVIPAVSGYDPYGGTNITITHSEIANNGYGIVTRDPSIVAVHNNSIHGNRVGVGGIHFENNWWGDASGPHEVTKNPHGVGDEVGEFVEYRPWLTTDPLLEVQKPTCCSNVAFLPGIEASRLYSGSGAKLWEPFTNADVKKLYLDSNGNSIDPKVTAGGILDTFKALNLVGPSIYRSFIQEMDGLVGDGTIKAWKALPYDWRQSVTAIAANGMEDAIAALAENSSTGKVTLVAHSNGGLVAKALMQRLEADGKADLVDKIIFVAVPQLGTPDALNALLHGVNFPYLGRLLMDRAAARGLAENMPGAYGLLPSSEYFKRVTDPVITFDQTVNSIGNFIATYGADITTKSELDDFLSAKEGRKKPSAENTNPPNALNQTLLAQADSLHQLLDGWQPPAGVDFVQIAGIGKDTIKGIKYIGKYPCTKLLTAGACAPYLDEAPIMTKDGDDTVVYPSAVSEDSPSWYVDLASYAEANGKNYDHKDILEVPPLVDFIKKIILNESEDSPFISSTKPTYASAQSIRVSMHSPASIDLYDAQGRHTGLIANQSNPEVVQYEEQIPNSYYMEFGEGKYAGFPADSGSKISIQGTGTGTFTLSLEHLDGDAATKTETFADVPVTPDTKAEVLTDTNGKSSLALDTDGNGTKDFTIQPSGNNPDDSIDPVLFLQIMKQTIQSMKLPRLVEKMLLMKIDRAIKFVAKDKHKKIVPLIRQFSKMIENKHWKRSKKMSIDQRTVFLEMFGKLMDTIK